MSARWTEGDLANFKRNSGRGLPESTLKEMTRIQGVQLDTDGERVPKKVAAAAPVKKRKRSPTRRTREKDLSAPAVAQAAGKAQAKIGAVLGDVMGLHKSPSPAPSKLRNRKTSRDGIIFHSMLEADYYTQLCFEQKAGNIDFFQMQVPYRLEGGVKIVIDFVTYKAMVPGDLRLFEVHWIDTKGFHTRESKNKIKQVQARYPGLKVELVKKVRKLVSR